ncbi:MAG: hypothetical protein C0596_11005 [Marinilabiliales bacterium]|nr:MAG: hypothetical protein C0596_11005 [Marinilabiliales bacterium]
MKKLFSYIIVSLCVINLYGQTLIATSSHPDATANHNQRKIVRDTLDNVYIVYQDIIEGDTVIMGLYFDRMSEIWTTPTQITTGKNPTISISKDCIFHLFYELNGSVTNIMYRRSDDFNTWTGELLLSDPLVESVLPIADVDSSGLVNVMWISGEDEETILRLCRIKNDEIIKDTVLLEKPYISDITIANHLLFGNQTIMYAVNFDIDSIYYFSKLEFFDEADLLYATEGTNPCVTYNYFYDTIYDFTSSFHFPYINSIGQVRSVYGDHATVGFKNQYVYESLLGDWGAKYVCVDDVLLPLGYSFLFLNDQGLYHVFAGDGGVYKMMDSIETGSPYNPSIAYRHFRFDLVDFIWTDSTS